MNHNTQRGLKPDGRAPASDAEDRIDAEHSSCTSLTKPPSLTLVAALAIPSLALAAIGQSETAAWMFAGLCLIVGAPWATSRAFRQIREVRA